jgi:PKD repeat protein
MMTGMYGYTTYYRPLTEFTYGAGGIVHDVGVSDINSPQHLDDCGSLPVSVDVTNYGNQPEFFNTQVNIYSGTPGGTILDEDFEGTFPPTGWTVTNDGNTPYGWRRNDQYGRTNYMYSGYCADADADATGSGGPWPMDTSLYTPVMDLSTYTSAYLEFDNYYNYLSGDYAQCSISSNGGSTWSTLFTWTSDHYNVHSFYDISPYISNQVQVRFKYYADSWDWYWLLDNVEVWAPSSQVLEYTNTQGMFLLPGQTLPINTFPNWICPGPGYYEIEACTLLPGDIDPMNDCMSYTDMPIGDFDVGATIVVPQALMGPVPHDPVIDVDNFGDLDATGVAVRTQISVPPSTAFYEDFEALAGFNTNDFPESEVDDFDEEKFEPVRYQDTELFRTQGKMHWDGDVNFGDVNQWSMNDNDGDGITWHATTWRWSSPIHSMYNGDETTHTYPNYSDDELISPMFNTGGLAATYGFDYWLSYEGYYWDTFIWGSSPNGVNWDLWWFGSWPGDGMWHTISGLPLYQSAAGDAYIGFFFTSDSIINGEGVYIDNVEVIKGGLIYDETMYTDVAAGLTETLVFPTFTPIDGVDYYDIVSCTYHMYDEDGSNDCDGLTFATNAPVYILENGYGFNTIQAAIDAAVAGQTVIATDGTYHEDIVIDKDITVKGENPPTSTAVIHGTVTIIGDGATLENFHIWPLTVFHTDAAAVTVLANDVTVQNNIITGPQGLVDQFAGDSAFTVSGIWAFEGQAPVEGLVIQNNAIYNVINNNVTGGAGGTMFWLEDFEFGPIGWTIRDPAADGGWYLGPPKPSGVDLGGATGLYMAISDYGSNNGNNYFEELVSPPVSCVGYVGVSLDFNGDFEDFAGAGEFFVDCWDGSSWQNVLFQTVDLDPGGSGTGWNFDPRLPIDVSMYADGNPNFQFRFVYTDIDDPPSTTAGWGALVDDVELLGVDISNIGAPYGGADGIKLEGQVEALVDSNTINDIHSKGWSYGVEIIPLPTPLLGAYPDTLLFEDFEGTGLPGGWRNVDQDGDGYDWDLDWAYPIAGSESAGSASYINGVGPLSPDNWLITEQIDLGGYSAADLTFWTKAQDPYWPSDKIEVRISTTGNNPGDFSDLIYSFTETDDTPKEHILDLTPYAGDQIYIAFRHTDSYDWYWIILDDIEVTGQPGGGPGPGAGAVDIVCNDFDAIGDGSFFDQAETGICVAVQQDGNAGSHHVNCNNFNLFQLAIVNRDTDEILDAKYNWYDDFSGPSGGAQDPLEGIFADGYGAMIVDEGPVNFVPWLGIVANIMLPAGPSITAEVGEPILFDATGSTAWIYEECCDPFETHMQYEWDFDDGTYSHNPRTTHTYTSPGTYNVRLMVDAPGIGMMYFGFDYIEVIVIPAGSPLSANADGENLGGYEGVVEQDIQFFGTATGGSPRYTYHWEFGDGAYSYERNPVHAYLEVGEYTATLTVTDSEGKVAQDTTTVLVYDIDELVVNIDNTQNEYSQGETITFLSAVEGGQSPYSYNWQFGDGTMSTAVSPTHVYEYSGTYTVILSVTDSRGLTQTSSKTIIIRETGDITEVEITDVSGGFLFSATIISTEQVAWSIDITQGLVLMGGHADGIAQGNTQVRLPFTFALGQVEITVNAGGVTRTYHGDMVGPFLFNLE